MSDIQDRITAARREAENLKARIKTKKEELADADRKYLSNHYMRWAIHDGFLPGASVDITILQFAKSPKRASNRYLARA